MTTKRQIEQIQHALKLANKLSDEHDELGDAYEQLKREHEELKGLFEQSQQNFNQVNKNFMSICKFNEKLLLKNTELMNDVAALEKLQPVPSAKPIQDNEPMFYITENGDVKEPPSSVHTTDAPVWCGVTALERITKLASK